MTNDRKWDKLFYESFWIVATKDKAIQPKIYDKKGRWQYMQLHFQRNMIILTLDHFE
jgi:hypothetical protein